MDIIDDVNVSFYVHRRDGNKKRNFVLVNKNLAKHYPCVAADTFRMCRQLAEKGFNSKDTCGDIVVIAFAETATALGVIAAKRLKELSSERNVFLITTTREDLGKGFPVLEFQEEHSHASRQVMYFGSRIEEKLNSCTRLVIIDDELSTGGTILNLLDNIEKKCRLDKFASVEAWSLLNGMCGSDKEKYKSRWDKAGIPGRSK